MPIFEYVCNDCQREFEFLVHGGAKPHCEACGSEKLTKLLSVAAAHSHRSGQPDLPPCCPGGSPLGGMCGMGGCGIPGC
jgi:putative FmdB family regulatory protein